MKSELVAALLKNGQQRLAETLDLSSSSVSRKINGEEGWTLDQLAAAFEFVDIRLVGADQVVVDQDEHAALVTLARKCLDRGRRATDE